MSHPDLSSSTGSGDQSPVFGDSPRSNSSNLSPNSASLSGKGITPVGRIKKGSVSSRKWSFDSVDTLSEDVFPRSEWMARVMKKHSDVLELRERTRWIYSEKSFGRRPDASRTEVKDVLPSSLVTQMIYQFLHDQKLDKTLRLLEETTKISYSPQELLEEDVLTTLLKIGIKDISNLFGPLEPDVDEDPEVEAVEQTYDYGDDDDSSLFLASPKKENQGNSNVDGEKANTTNNEDRIIFANNQIIAGSVNQLIGHLIETQASEKNFRRIFFSTYHTFITPEKLLNKLLKSFVSVEGDLPKSAEFSSVQSDYCMDGELRW